MLRTVGDQATLWESLLAEALKLGATRVCGGPSHGVLMPATVVDKVTPGMAALITGGSFYQLENTGTGHMIMMGHRSGNQDNVAIIDYVTRQDIRKTGGPKVRNHADVERKPA